MKTLQKQLLNKLFFTCIAILSLFSSSANAASFTQQEILDELSEVRNNRNAFRMADNTHPQVKYFLDRIDEDKVLKATTSWVAYLKTYITMWTALPFEGLVMLTKDNAPKTCALVEEVANKVGITELPLLYVVEDEQCLNAFATGFLRSLSAVTLGERFMKEQTSIEAIEFIIAHELTHIKNRDMLKKWALGLITYHAAYYCISSLTKPYRDMILSEIPANQELSYIQYFELDNLNVAEELTIAAITALIASYYSRICEYNADIGAIHALGAQGGMDLFRMLQEKFEPNIERDFAKLQEKIAQSTLNESTLFHLRVKLAKLFASIRTIFATHPTDTERLANIKNYMHN